LIWKAVLLAPKAANVDAVIGVNPVEVPVGMMMGAKEVVFTVDVISGRVEGTR
jgi:hypothetical protein